MASSYPPPPGSLGELDAVSAASQAVQEAIGSADPSGAVGHQGYENGVTAAGGMAQHHAPSAVEAAHQGLQALQAATGLPAMGQSPVTPQYAASLPSPHGPGMQYLQTTGSSLQLGASGQGTPTASTPVPKVTRLRRACDMCSQRKVKCDEGGPPCRPCRELGVECTNNREVKRRGPPNKHAEAAKAAKRPRVEPDLMVAPASHSSHHAAEALVAIAAQDGAGMLDAESIAPWDVLVHLVDDFFTYIHPLTPFPHEPTFREALMNREDRTNREFLALLASMISALVASFPRSARQHLKSQQSTNLFPRANAMIDRCRVVALEARGAQYQAKEEASVYDAATSYFLGLSAGYTMQWTLCRRFLAEALSTIRELGFNRPRGSPVTAMGSIPYTSRPVDHIQEQIGNRIFWVLLLGIRSMAQLAASHHEIVLPPPTPGEPYPEFPAEVDDQYIEAHQILPQPEGTVPLIAGFNMAIRIYMTMNPLVSIELSYGISTLPFYDQKDMLNMCLDAVKDVINQAPRELALSLTPIPASEAPVPSAQFGANDDFYDDAPGFQYYPPGYPAQRPDDLRHVFESSPQRRRHLQLQIQKANIYLSQIATRSYYVERYLNLRDADRENAKAQAGFAADAANASSSSNGAAADTDNNKRVVAGADTAKAAAAADSDSTPTDPIDTTMTAERELIVQNLLAVLAALPQRSMEPNGASIINKIRQVASTLLNDAPERKGPVATEAEAHLAQFVNILMRLERTGGGPAGGSGNADPALGLGVALGELGGSGSGGPGGGNNGAAAGVGAGLGTMTTQDEEEELRSWADWRLYQARFAARGGFMGASV